ncbi:hypothetical protein E4U21_006684 [Claviceps maximensis]|nr:hypothetical protein E4U21_006684 [Claviceps maximensis]
MTHFGTKEASLGDFAHDSAAHSKNRGVPTPSIASLTTSASTLPGRHYRNMGARAAVVGLGRCVARAAPSAADAAAAAAGITIKSIWSRKWIKNLNPS